MEKELSKYILTTVAYYDILDYPMTSFEIWKYLTKIGESSGEKQCYLLTDVVRELSERSVRKVISESRGYYFLRGGDDLVDQRLERNKIAEKKFKTVRRIVWLLRFVPFVRMVAVTGSMAMKNTEVKSDLDLLIALKHGHIFTGRALVTLAVHLIGKRRHGHKIANRICLNYFVTTQSLEINLKDAFSSSEYSFILPLFGFRYFRRFQKNNTWISRYKINHQADEMANLKILKDTNYSKATRKTGEKIFGWTLLENALKKWQLERIDRDRRTHVPGSSVMADDENLIFLPDPQGPKVFEKFMERLENISSQS